MTTAPEFSRSVALARLGTEPFRQEIAATAAERDALARRFDLVALDRLEAVVTLVRQGPELILLCATFDAAYEQECVVTLEPIAGALSGEFSLIYGPLEAEDTAATVGGEDVAFEPLAGAAIDLGEAVAQEFSLALPPFPRSPDVELHNAPPAADAGPFAALLRLVERPDD